MLWLDTTTEKLKRCTAITPSVAWEVVPAGEVHTAVIDVDDNGMNVLSGGNLNLLAGGNLNIKNLGNTANVINMDSTGLTLSSTGQLKLQSTDSIIIGGSPFSVGGTNFVKLSKPAYFSNNNYKLGEFYLDSGLSDGETVTISAKIALATGRESIDIYNSGTEWENLVTSLFPSDKGADGIYRKTVPWKVAGTNSVIYLYVPPSGNTENSGFYWIKIEKGTHATDWSPAPSDPASSVKTSKIEIGSDFIDIDSGGTLTLNAAEDLVLGGQNITAFANESISLAVSNIRIGGRNLLRNSSRFKDTAFWSASWAPSGTYGVSVISMTDYGGVLRDMLVFNSTGGNGVLSHTGNPLLSSLKEGDSVVLSFLTKWSLPANASVSFKNSSSNTVGWGQLVLVKVTDDWWCWYEAQITITGPCNGAWMDIYPVSDGIAFDELQLEIGNKKTPWTPAPEDPASGVKTASVEVNSNGIYMDTTGEISMNAGTTFKVNSGTVQVEAGDASNSSLRFGNAFSVNKEGADYKLAINSQSDDAIMVNSKPVWHKGNLVVSKTQPPTGNETVWIKPGAGSGAVLNYQTTITSNVAYAGGGSQTIALANQTGDTSTTAGTYTFSVTFTLRRYAVNQRVPNINTTGGSVVLTKGGAFLTLGAIPSLQFGPWHDRTVTVTGSTTNTAFASTTGDISCVITVAGTPAYGGDDFIAHARPSLVSCTINAPGSGGSVQPCELFFVP
jgi:hypothetical protein